MRALQLFLRRSGGEPVARPQGGSAVDADDCRRPVRARILPVAQREPAAARRPMERSRPSCRSTCKDDAPPDQLQMVDELRRPERARRPPRVRVEGPGAPHDSGRTFPTWPARPTRLERNPFPASFEVRLKPEVRDAGGAVDNLADDAGRRARGRRRPLRPPLAGAAECGRAVAPRRSGLGIVAAAGASRRR